jgi:DNA-binding NtrC family response regulator
MQSLIQQQQGNILVASSCERFRARVREAVDSAGWAVGVATGGAEVLAVLESGSWQGVLLDSWLPDLDVTEVVRMIRSAHSGLDVLIRDVATGRLAVPFQCPNTAWLLDQLDELPAKPAEPIEGSRASLSVQDTSSRAVNAEVASLPGMIGRSPAMLRVYRLVRLASPRATTVLVTGESGTGKELIAGAIHSLSPRANRPFVVVNCAAIPDTLLETEMFGHTKGAFSGAAQSRVGRIQAASGGTLFLDEIGELPIGMQAKLLRFLQSGEIQRLGANETARVDVRVVAATNANLAERVEQGSFREDLYYRLVVFPIALEPLRIRPEDILLLAEYFLESLCRESGAIQKQLSLDSCRFLEQYSWPGNVRELRQAIERAFILSEQEPVLSLDHFWFPLPAATLKNS